MNKQQVNSFYDELRESFVRIGARPIPLLAICLWFIGTLLLSDINTLIPLKIIGPIILGLVIITAALFNLAKRLYAKAIHKPPRILQYYQPPRKYHNAIGLVLEASGLYGFHSPVSIYYKDEAYESLIGIGVVDNISDDGLIQVVAWSQEDTYDDIWNRVCQNDILCLKKISIKPFVPIEFLEGVNYEFYKK